jgi:Leucine-rich repeat (LRR) protein
LRTLWLVDNQLDEGTGYVLKEILIHNKALTWINLLRNYLTDADAEEIADGLSQNTTLEELTLTDNKFTETGKRILRSGPEGTRLKKRLKI